MGFIHDELVRDGHEVDYLCADDVAARFRGRAARFVFPALVLQRAIRAFRLGRPYDVVNVHEPASAAIALGKGLARRPAVVVTSHGVERRAWALALEERRLGREGPSLRTRIIYPTTGLWQADLGLRYADHIFCLNSEDRDFLKRRLGVRAGVTRICPAAEPVFAERGASRRYDRAARILFAGTWRKNKGIEDLVPAFERLARRHDAVELVVLGAGMPEDTVLGSFSAASRGRVTVSRARSDEEFAKTYASADLFVQPSLFEGTPQTLIEAMASGLPIVATETCGMRDVIDNKRNGLLVPIRSPERIADAVEELMGDSALRERLGHEARRDAVAKYVWTEVAAPVREAYEQLYKSRLS